MTDEWVHAMFGVNYDDNFDTVMNRVIDHINYSGTVVVVELLVIAMVVVMNELMLVAMIPTELMMMMIVMKTKMKIVLMTRMNRFGYKSLIIKKLLLCIAGALHMYYDTYVYKKPCIVSYNTRMRWLKEVVRRHWKQCVNIFRIDATTLQTFVMTWKHNMG